MTKVVSNKRQLRRLVELLQQNIDIAKASCPKSSSQKKWEEFAIELNKIGPPQRVWQRWMRVWADLKCKIKKKKTEDVCSSGNQKRPFSDLEETVIEMLDYNTLIVPPPQDIEDEDEDSKMSDSTEDVKYSPSDFDEEMMKYNSYESLNTITEEPPITIKTEKIEVEDEQAQEQYSSYMAIEKPKPITPHPMDEYNKILKEQTAAQQQFYNKMIDLMGDMKRSMSNIEDYIKKGVQQREDLLEMKRLKLKAYKDTNINETIDRKAKLRIKAELLAFKKKKQNSMAERK